MEAIPVNLGTVVLASLAHASLSLTTGALLLLYHSSLGKEGRNIKKHTKRLATNYIFGTALLTALIVSSVAFFIYAELNGSLPLEWLAVLTVVLIVLATIVWFFYYKTGRSTELWLPRSVSKYINNRAKNTDSNTEAFGLGMLACFTEMPFSLILSVVAANAVIALPDYLKGVSVLIYTIIAILPELILRLSIQRGRSVAEVQRFRVENKSFLRFLSGFLFLTLATFLIAFTLTGRI